MLGTGVGSLEIHIGTSTISGLAEKQPEVSTFPVTLRSERNLASSK
jgi:hypothetical protein